MSGKVRLIAVAAAAALGAGPAWAHHSFAMFDMNQENTLSSTVKDFQLTNPHSWVWLTVADGAGGTDQWGLEGMSPNYLERRGWSKRTISPGDKVTVVIHPVRNGEHGGELLRMTLPDGKEMVMFGEPPASKP